MMAAMWGYRALKTASRAATGVCLASWAKGRGLATAGLRDTAGLPLDGVKVVDLTRVLAGYRFPSLESP